MPVALHKVVLHKYVERPLGGFSNLSFPSGERILVSLASSGLRIHDLRFFGLVPARTRYVADASALSRLVATLSRDIEQLPELPDSAAMQAFMVSATVALTDAARILADPEENAGKEIPDAIPHTRLSVLTRAALAEAEVDSYVRTLTRAANIV